MKIIIPTIGTRGDIQPYLALAAGLNQAGHRAEIATHPFMRTLVESHEIDFVPIGPDINIGLETARMRGKGSNLVLGFLRVMNFSFEMIEKIHADLSAACQNSDLIVVSHTGAGSIQVDALEKPSVSVTLTPQAIPSQNSQSSPISKVFGKIAGAGMGFFMRRPLNKIRKKFGVPPMGQAGITSPILNLVPISPAVLQPDIHWETRHQTTGFWFAANQDSWMPPEELMAFLADGHPPVLVSLGAMAISGEDAFEAASITVKAVEQAGLRAIVQGWDEVIESIHIPSSILHAGPMPHSWILEHCSGIIHHGGFGTTAAGFRAGIPAVVIPHIIDQFIWGAKVQELGVGPQPISRKKLSVERLTEALLQLSTDIEMREKAAALGSKIRSENGVERAIELIEAVIWQHFSTHHCSHII